MARLRIPVLILLLSAAASLAASSCEKSGKPYLDLGGTRLITLLQTNDMHGSVESSLTASGHRKGGMAIWSGVVSAIRRGLHDQYGNKAGVLVLDSGDQFQGTLLSNHNEGALVFQLMNQIGYDAAIPGNHGYDFGPAGWLDDVAKPGQDPREVLKNLAAQARFPLLSANTFLRDSIQSVSGEHPPAKNVGCRLPGGLPVNWSKAKRPEYLKPYLIREVAGVRVALIGIDSSTTSQTTAFGNVADLCFADEIESYLRLRSELHERADVFVMILHEGNSPKENEGGAIQVARALGASPEGAPLVDAIIAGHTHSIQEQIVDGVPIVQSGGRLGLFGRIDLVWNTGAKALDRARTRVIGGLELAYDSCPEKARDFCAQAPEGAPQYEGHPLKPDGAIEEILFRAARDLAPIADRTLGIADQKLWSDRIRESPLANAMTDSLRAFANTEIAFMNTGGLRSTILPGPFSYSQLFEVLPFNNRAVVVGPMPFDAVLALLLRSARSCGEYGALMQSGLRVEIEKNCESSTTVDPRARLLRVETLAGEILLDVKTGTRVGAERSFMVATLDFLASGGSGYSEFTGAPLVADLGVLREKMTEQLLHLGQQSGTPVRFSGRTDGRWKTFRRPMAESASSN